MMPEKDSSSTPAADLPVISSPPRAARSRLALVLASLALLASAAQWVDGRRQAAVQADLVVQEQAAVAHWQQEHSLAQDKARQQFETLQGRLGEFEEKLSAFAESAEAWQSQSRDLVRGREETLLLEVEQAITLAAQQLQLAGNVRVALLALQSADARLARLERSQLLPLRKALAKDVERLQALPLVDLAGMSLRLEQVLLGIDQLPLAAAERPPVKVETSASDATATWWQSSAAAVWTELRDLIRIQRFDRNEPGLMAPGQAYFLRENLKLRLLNARLALLSREQAVFRNELKAVRGLLEQHFQASDAAVQGALKTLLPMQGLEINAEMPSLNDSQAALQGLRQSREKR